MMTEKPFYLSKTVWGALVTLGALIAGLFNVELDAALQTELTETLSNMGVAFGALLALYGRVKANKSLK